MNIKEIRRITAIGTSAVVTVAAAISGIKQDRSSLGTDFSAGMSTTSWVDNLAVKLGVRA